MVENDLMSVVIQEILRDQITLVVEEILHCQLLNRLLKKCPKRLSLMLIEYLGK